MKTIASEFEFEIL